jgi:hypothetical protein
MKNKGAHTLPEPTNKYALSGDTLRGYGAAMSPTIVIEKLISFTYRNDKWDMVVHSGEVLPNTTLWKLRIPLPSTLLAGELTAEVAAPQALEKPEEEERRKGGTRFWRR